LRIQEFLFQSGNPFFFLSFVSFHVMICIAWRCFLRSRSKHLSANAWVAGGADDGAGDAPFVCSPGTVPVPSSRVIQSVIQNVKQSDFNDVTWRLHVKNNFTTTRISDRICSAHFRKFKQVGVTLSFYLLNFFHLRYSRLSLCRRHAGGGAGTYTGR
jgi:hypothetical protein